MYPQVKYDTCKLRKHRPNLNACSKKSGFDEQYLTKKEPIGLAVDPPLCDAGDDASSLVRGADSSSLSKSNGFI
jgi:hypothetical protein